MTKMNTASRGARLVLMCAAAGLALSACNRTQSTNTTADVAPPLGALPLAAGDTPTVPAPSVGALPAAAPVRVGRLASPDQGYAYLDRAYALSHAFADAPPDYAYDWHGERPWVWRASDGATRVAERLPSGMRYFYYEPGASDPYLVQDPDDSYAYSGGELVGVYGPGGQALSYDASRADTAGRYLAWAAGLYAASLSQNRYAVEEGHWRDRQAQIAQNRERWAADQNRDAGWNAYHQAHWNEEQAHWANDRYRREAEVAHYAQQRNDSGAAAAAWAAAQQARANRGSGPPQDSNGQGGDGLGGNGQGGYGQGGYGQRGYAPGGHAGDRRGPAYDQGGGQPPYGPRDGRFGQAQGAGFGGGPVGDPALVRQQAEAPRRAAFQQGQAQQDAQRQAADQAHQGQMQAARAQQQQAQQGQQQMEAQRRAAMDQSRAQADAQRQAADQAHQGQMQAARAQQQQAQQQGQQQMEAQRRAAMDQSRAQADAQRQAADQAHQGQMQAARAQQQQAQQQAQAQRQAADQARAAAQQQAHAAQAQAQQAQQQARAQADAQRQAAQQQAHAAQAQAQQAQQQARAQAEAQRRAAQAQARPAPVHGPGDPGRRDPGPQQ